MTTKPTPEDAPALTTAGRHPGRRQPERLTAGPRGPVLVQDWQLFEKHAHFNRERIPERVVHAKGSGAYGTFTVTDDITQVHQGASCSPTVGKKTECFLRFSTVAGERGAADAERDVRGFALKFYTEEGNWDLVGNNTPVFFVRDPLQVPRLHPHAEARSADQPAQHHGDVGLLVAVARRACTRSRSCSPTAACRAATATCTASAATPTASSTPRTSASGSNSTSRRMQGIAEPDR